MMTSTYRAEVDGRAADLTVSYTVEQKNGEPRLCSLDSARARNVHGWEQVHLAATVEQHQSLFGSGLYQYLVPVSYEADRGSGWETFQAVVEISLTGQYSPRHTLTQEELAAYNAVTDPFHDAEGNPVLNPQPQQLEYLLMSYYNNVYDLSLRNFLNYFPGESGISDAEYEALLQMPGWAYPNRGDICRIPAASVKDVLFYWGSVMDMDRLTNTEGTFYLPEYDAYYVGRVDDFNTWFTAKRGEQIGNYVYLYGVGADDKTDVLTLRLSGVEGDIRHEWTVVSYWALN